MLSRRVQIASSIVGTVFFGIVLVVALVRDLGTPRVVLSGAVMVLELLALISAIRRRPLPPLSIDRLRVQRRQTLLAVAVLAVLAGAGVVAWQSSVDPRRSTYLLMAACLALVALALLWAVARYSQIIRGGEIPTKVRRRYDDLQRRRML